jgi:TetR/AcrR family transcriptional regulator
MARRDGTTPPPRSRSRGRILEAALRAFSEQGFHETTMDDIAARAGVARGTLYYNFPGKSEMFTALVDEGLGELLDALRREMVSDLPFPKHFRRLVGVQVDLLLQHRDLFRLAARPASAGLDEATVQRIEAARDRYAEVLEGMLREGIEQGYLRPFDTSLVASEIQAMLDGLLHHERRTGRPVDRDKVADEMAELLARGLRAPRRTKRL